MSTSTVILFESENEKWDAVVSNCHDANGVFWYGVTSTKIVCKPSCSSRAPKRENVLFFDDLSLALEDGFRCCKRCKP